MGFLVDLIFIPINLAVSAVTLICCVIFDIIKALFKAIFKLFKLTFRKLTTKQEKYEEQTVTTLYQKQEFDEKFDESEWVVCGKLDRSNTQE